VKPRVRQRPGRSGVDRTEAVDADAEPVRAESAGAGRLPADGSDAAPADVPPTDAARRPAAERRPLVLRRKPLMVTAGVLVGVMVLAAAADVLLERTARERIARAATCELRPTGPVSAELSGSLAGLRLLTGRVGTVHIEAEDVRRGGTSMSVAADLHQVTTKGSTSGGSATATISYDELRKRLGSAAAGLMPGADGHGGLVLTGTFAGIPLPVTVHTRITTAADSLTVAPTDVSILGGNFPLDRLAARPDAAGLAAELKPRTVKAPELPAGVRLSGTHAGGDGLGLTLSISRTVTSGSAKRCPA
jgi:LmeA-like phospholipid-binding